jgi:hypothetical protein
MLIHRVVKAVWASGAVGLVLAAALGAVPAPLHATEIAWHSTSELTYYCPPNWRREGTVMLETGEDASFVAYGTIYARDDKGIMPYKAEYVFRFDDGSTITAHVAGSADTPADANGGVGEIVFGTGRYDGIAGKISATGRPSDSSGAAEWVCTYSLPNQ